MTGGGTACPADVFTAGLANGGFERNQDLSGNSLPNAPKNKIAFNVNYTWRLSHGSLAASASYIWRDKQYGTLFTRPDGTPYNPDFMLMSQAFGIKSALVTEPDELESALSAAMAVDEPFLLEVRTRGDVPMPRTGYWDIADFLE